MAPVEDLTGSGVLGAVAGAGHLVACEGLLDGRGKPPAQPRSLLPKGAAGGRCVGEDQAEQPSRLGPTEEGLYSDARAALDFFARQGLGAERLVLYGESLGSAVAVQMATERSVAALILEAPMTSVAAVAQARYPIFPVRWLVLDRFDSLAKIGSVRAPLLLMHGERDTVVPIRFGRVLFEAANEPKEARYFTDAGHNDLQAFGAPDAVLDFLERLNR